MARYRLHGVCFLDGRRLRAGEEVPYEGPPGEQMEPLDEAAWEAFHAYHAERKRQGLPAVTRFSFKVRNPQAPEAAPVSIPDNWRGLQGMAICHLAVKLGASRRIKRDEAFRYVEEIVAKQSATDPSPAEEESDEEDQEITDGE